MIHKFYVLLIHIVMDIFEIVISMIKHILYVIIIMLIYGIKMIWKMPIFLTVSIVKRQQEDKNKRHIIVYIGFTKIIYMVVIGLNFGFIGYSGSQ
jgi:hypothetical protein